MTEGLINALPFMILGVLMYVMLILPQRRRTRDHRELMASLQEGDEILTTAGLYGFVKEVEDEVVWLEVADGMELRVTRDSIASRVVAESGDSKEST